MVERLIKLILSGWAGIFPFTQIERFTYMPMPQTIDGCMLQLFWATTKTSVEKPHLVFIDNGIGFIRSTNRKLIILNASRPAYNIWVIGWRGIDTAQIKIPVRNIVSKDVYLTPRLSKKLLGKVDERVTAQVPAISFRKSRANIKSISIETIKPKVEAIESMKKKLNELTERLPHIESLSNSK